MATTKGVEVTGIYNKMPLFRACPNCGSQIHVRKLACPCGHSVFRGSKLLTTKNASRKSDVGAARALETDIPEEDAETLHAFGNTIREIADVDREVTAADLLATPPFKTISYNPDKNIITGFTKQ